MPSNYQQSGLSTRRVVFVVLLVVSLVLVTVYAREGDDGPIHAVQNGVMSVTGQVGRIGAGIGGGTETLGNAVDDATANQATLTALREQNEQLRKLLADTDEYRQEAERLRALLDMKQVSGVTGPAAHIIGRSANAWDQSITIDLGSEDGVEAGMTVMGATGVIGQVVRTADNSSTVRLLTDPNSGAAVMIQSTRAYGIVRGSLDGLLYLEDIDEDQIPQVGDVVLTSGMGGSYERGLIVGAVVSVNKTTSNATGTIIVSPNDDASLLEEVIVVSAAPDMFAIEKAEAERQAEEEAQRAAEEAELNELIYGDYSEGSGYDDYSY